MTGTTGMRAGVCEFITELRGRCFISYLCLLDFDGKIYVRGGHTLRFTAENSHCVL